MPSVISPRSRLDRSFLLLFFQKRSASFLKKETKNFYPNRLITTGAAAWIAGSSPATTISCATGPEDLRPLAGPPADVGIGGRRLDLRLEHRPPLVDRGDHRAHGNAEVDQHDSESCKLASMVSGTASVAPRRYSRAAWRASRARRQSAGRPSARAAVTAPRRQRGVHRHHQGAGVVQAQAAQHRHGDDVAQ